MSGSRPAALVTGGARRIGAGLARHLGGRGFAVVLHHHGSVEEAQATAAAIRAGGGTCHLLAADLADAAAVETLVPRAIALEPGLSLLVNNAARFVHDRVETLTRANWDAHLAVNLTAPAFLAQAFAAQVERGVIVNLTDFKVTGRPDPAFLSYTVAKAGLGALTDLLAVALAPRIRVAAIAPGFTLPGGKQTREKFDKAFRAAPLGTGSTIEDLARALDFIIDSPALTGLTLTIDGGMHLL
ncbi:SDR family oxidoreductase [Oleomonas cavernae]|uniref:SDR family oxidoreductase n=1 Tax=Oleomonas cavernae TaxID=2320859 RepID=A0A418VTZ3_9PROT|nr:SDR family oxidoreductase [Oleomonas cavernae]RJF80622.1 SDR family oxidoreductase [Oleomonas cavernae]